ncbi:MAG: HAMP domain-containing protein [Betaproteobacteria bacterium]|nr:HAMP domain-containing protein [Betaproteobacteria bacterium]
MIRSLRLRIALLSALLAGVALCGFALLAGWLIREAKIERLDAEIRAEIQRERARPRPAEEWAQYEDSLARIIGSGDPAEVLVLITDRGGSISYRSRAWPPEVDSGRLPWPDLRGETYTDGMPPGVLGTQPLPLVTFVQARSENDAQTWRMGLASGPRQRMAIGASMRLVDNEMAAVRNAFVVAIPLALLLIGAGAWWTSARAFDAVRRVTSRIEQMTARGLDQRIQAGAEDQEFGQLIEVVNGMLERLERSFHQAARFSADAAHELRTPLAILQGEIERALNQAETGSAMQAALSSILDEVRRLSSIARKLLLLSQADAGRLRLQLEPVDLTAILDEIVEDARMLSPGMEISASVTRDLRAMADEHLLAQVLWNLLNNAIKYNIERGWIRIEASTGKRGVEVVVANASNGIPPAERERIFERFYRADASRRRAVDGVGLGLSVAREIVLAHHGKLELDATLAGEIRFVLTLPATS